MAGIGQEGGSEGQHLEPSTPRWCPERDFPALVLLELLETEAQVSPGPGPRPGGSYVNC